MITLEIILNWLLHAVVSFLASAAVGILYHTPKKHIVDAGLTGTLGWVVYVILTHFGASVIFASFLPLYVSQFWQGFSPTRKKRLPQLFL